MTTVNPSDDSPAGAEGGGTVDSPEQLSGCEETLQDDACKITIIAKGSDGSTYEDIIEYSYIGLSFWFHLKQCGKLESILRSCHYEMKETSCDNIVLTYMGNIPLNNSFFMSQCRMMHQILEKTTENYCHEKITGDEKQMEFIVKNWTKTDLYLSRKATAHRARSGCLIIVAEKSCRNEVSREVQKLKEQCKHAMQSQDDVGNLPAVEGKGNCSLQPEQHTSSHSKWEPVQDFLKGDGEMVHVMLQTTIHLTDSQLSFISSRQEAQDYVASCFQKQGIKCAFDFNDRCIYLTAEKHQQRSVFDDLVMSGAVPFFWVNWCPIKDLTYLLEKRFENSKGKFMVDKNEMEHSLTVMATNDIFQDIFCMIGMIMVDAADKVIELDRANFEYLRLLEQWKVFEPLLVDTNTGVVLIRPNESDTKCSIQVMGKKAHVKEFCSRIAGYFQSRACKCVPLSDDKSRLIQTCQGAVKFIEQAVKERGYEMHIRDHVVLISDDISKFEKSSRHFFGLILSKLIRLEKPIFEFFTQEELHDLLDKDFKAYHDKLVIHVDKNEHCLTLAGTKDIFPAVEKQIEEMQAQYKLVEQEVPLSPEIIECFRTQSRSELQKVIDDLRFKVKVNFQEQGEPRCRVSGPMIEVEKVKVWINGVCTQKQQKNINKEVSRVITLEELEHQLLKQSAFARDFVRQEYKQEGFGFDMDAMFRKVTVTVVESEDMSKALRLLSLCLKIFSVDLGQEQIDLTPKQAKDMVCERLPDLTQRMFVFTKESENMLSLIVTKDVATTVDGTLKQIMDEYAHDEVCLYLKPDEISDVMKQVEKMKQAKSHHLELIQTSEKVEMKGPHVLVMQSWEAICELLRASKPSRNPKSSPTMRMCEQVVSKLVYVALEKNEQIRHFLEVYFDEHGCDFEVSHNKLRLFAASVTALQKVRKIFPTLIIEKRLSLVNEPVVKMLGMDKIGETLSVKPFCEGKLVTNVDVDSCQLRFVCTQDIIENVEDHFHQLIKMYEEAVIETSEEEHHVQQLEDELLHIEPVLKDKFRLYEEGGKLHVVAAGDNLMLVKKKVEQMLHWKIRERKVVKGLPNKKLKLTEIEFEFIQKPEVINYIDGKLELFDFKINRQGKSLQVYAMKDTSFDKHINDIHACFKEDSVDLSGEPVIENVSLSDIKYMLDVQKPLHHGKLLIRVDDQSKCLHIICTDDVQQAVFSKLHEIKKTFSDTKLLLLLSSEKWGHIKTLFPEVLQEIPQDVRIEYCSEQGLQIMGLKEQAIQAKAMFENCIEKLYVEEFPLSDDIEIFQTDEGQELIKDIQKNSECVITIQDHETCENEASEVAIKDYLAQLHLEQTSDCIRLYQWTSKSNCMITVIQGSMDDLCADVLAVPVVGGEVPSAFSSLKQDGSLKKRIQGLNQTKDQSIMIQCGSHGLSWLKTQRVVFFFVPVTLKEGKDKEKESVRKTVQHIITQEARGSQTPRNSSCVFVIETLNKKGLFAVGVKAIIRGAQEAFEECGNCIDVQLLADETTSSDVVKTLKKACPGSKQINLSSQVKKLKKKFPGKGNIVEQSKPSIKIVVGKLENVEADVLVNSAHEKLDLTYGVVSRALNAASEGQLQRECNQKYPNGLKPGEVAVTAFHRQTGKSCHVIHGVLYKFHPGSQDNQPGDVCWKVMYKFMYLCLHEASKLGVESIAFPVLGTGTLKYPVEKVANVMFTVVEWFLNETPTSSLKTVKFVVYEVDKDIIQVFDAEWMARSYKSSTKQGCMETRQKCGNVMLQFIASDIGKCNRYSDGLLCFWHKHQLKDPERHPLVGEHLKAIEWKTYGRTFDSIGHASTHGGNLPANFIFHTLWETDFMTSLAKALKRAAENKWRTVQMMLFPGEIGMNPKAFVSDLQDILKNIRGSVLSVVTIVVPEKAWYAEAVSQLTNSSGFISYVKNIASSLLQSASQASSTEASRTECCDKLIVTGRSMEDCKKGYHQVMEGIKQIQAALENSSSLTDRDDSSSVDPTPHQDSRELETEDEVFGICRVKIKPVVTENKDWISIKRNLEEIGLKIQSSNQHFYAEGSFSSVSKAHEQLSNPAPKPVATGFEKGFQQTGLYITVSNVHFEAASYFIGKAELERFCTVEDMPSSQIKIWFTPRQEDQEEVLILQQRIQGVIQDAVDLSTLDQIEVSKQKAHEVEKSVMSTDKHDVYIKYEDNKHVMIMFAEDWNAMSRAKKRILLQLGSGKVASRGKRRFTNQSDTTLKSSVKQNENPSSFVMESGAAVAEGRNFTVKVYKESIVTLKLDVIVNAANGQLRHGGGVARIIADAAGHQLLDEGNSIVQQKGDIPVTDLAVTNSGNLPCQRVFHAVGPRWSDYANKDKCLEHLCCTILRCLCEAVNRSYESIGFTSISSSIFGVPKESCAKMYVRALKSFDTAIQRGSLKEVHFVDVTEVMVNIIQAELRNSWTQPVNQENLAKDQAFIMKCLDSSTSARVLSLEVTPGEVKKKDKNDGIHWMGKSESVSLRIVRGDILKIKADSILSWENTNFTTTKPLQKLLDDAGGDSYRRGRDKACRSYKSYGEIAEGTGGSLPQKHVIFAVAHTSPTKEDVSNCLKKALDRCVKQKLTSLILTKPPSAPIDVELTFLETIVDHLIELDQNEMKTMLHVQIVEEQKHVVDGLTEKLQQYLSSCGLTATTTSNETEVSAGEDCVICCNEMLDPVKLKCGHQFCKQCVDKCFKIKAVCPVCKMKCGVITGNMPIGSMRDRFESYSDLPGFKECGTIVITYFFTSGKQTEEHPDPGKWYKGITRTAYLPGNAEGRKVLSLLKVAWKRRLTFTIGRSVTMGLDSCITWNEIHHKTNRDGGPTNHGYPDPDYLRRVQEELADQGVTEEDLGATGSTPV